MKRTKFVYGISLLAVILLNLFYINYQFFIMLLLVVLIPAVSWILFCLSRIEFKLFVRANQTYIEHQQTAELEIKAQNRYPISLIGVTMKVRIQYSNTQEQEILKASVDAHQDTSEPVRLRFCAMHCGRVNIHLEQVRLYDFLRLFCVRHDYHNCSQLVIMPKMIPISVHKKHTQRESDQDYAYALGSLDNSEVVDLREYMPGDELHHIHWKLSARSENLVVRQFGEPLRQDDVILIDLTLTSEASFRDDLDQIYQAAYSVGNYYIENKESAVFAAWDELNQKLQCFLFSNQETLMQAMVTVMDISCSKEASKQSQRAILLNDQFSNAKVLLITAQDYNSQSNQIFHVNRDDLSQVMEHLNRSVGER